MNFGGSPILSNHKSIDLHQTTLASSISQSNTISSTETPKHTPLQRKKCSRAISKTTLNGVSHVINPFQGCLYGCLYCYVPAMKYYTKLSQPWGSYLYYKHQFHLHLQQEMKLLTERKHNHLFLSSTTDPFQPHQNIIGYTSRFLNALIPYSVPCTILTKAVVPPKIQKILFQFQHLELGCSISTPSTKLAKILEPRAPSPHARLRQLKLFGDGGIPIYIMISPLLPGTSFHEIESLLDEISNINPNYVIMDSWHDYPILQKQIRMILPQLPIHHQHGFANYREKPDTIDNLFQTIHDLGQDIGISITNANTRIDDPIKY